MTRTEFRAFCAAHNLSITDAGDDWYHAEVQGAYLCAVISDEEDFAAVKPLIENCEAYPASAQRKNGHAWFRHTGRGCISSDEVDPQRVVWGMAGHYARFLKSLIDVIYFSAEDLARRDKALADSPRLEDEADFEYLQRLCEEQDIDMHWITPSYVTEPGYWNSDRELLLSDTQRKTGFWVYRYDDWEERVILILDETNEDE